MWWMLVYAIQVVMVGVGMLAVYCSLTLPTLLCVTSLGGLYWTYCRVKKEAAGCLPLAGKTVLITGCDTGIGHALAKELSRHECHVIATVFRPQGQGANELRDVNSDKMTVIPLDVSSDESVAQCLLRVKDLCKNSGLWALVNNAGHNFLGEVELTTMRQYLMVANINIYGMVRTTRAFLPLLRQAKGRIINVTSIKGQVSTPLNAAYNITKYGGETFSEITRMEMRKFGVKVVIVEPGNFGGATGCMNKEGIARIRREYEEMWTEASEDVKSIFSRSYVDRNLERFSQAACTTFPSVTPVVNTLLETLTSGDPDYRYIVDGSNDYVDLFCVLARLKPYVTDRFFDKLVAMMQILESRSFKN